MHDMNFTANSYGSMVFSSAMVFCCSGVSCACIGSSVSDGGGRSIYMCWSLNL